MNQYNLTIKIVAGKKETFRAANKAAAMVIARDWMTKELGRAPTSLDIATIRGYDEGLVGFVSAIAPALV